MIHWSEEQVYSHYTITRTVQVLQRQDGGLRTHASEKELTGAVILLVGHVYWIKKISTAKFIYRAI